MKKREGPGRPALPANQKKKRISTSLARDVDTLLRKQDVPFAQAIENAVRAYYEIKEK